MRKIDKGNPIPSFSEFVTRQHPAKWDDSKDVSRVWREYILVYEQHGLSGYTENPINLDSSHIDHFYKQSLFNKLVFDWKNLVVDSKDASYGAKFKDEFVRTKADNVKLINPVTEDACRYFQYELNGRISVANGLSDQDKERAEFTRDAFNLNESSLVERRRIIINIILDSFKDLSDEMILEALAPEGFTSVVEQLLKERSIEEESI